MRIDSEITLEAVKGCARVGIPVLPVHDSMLTPRRYESRVAEIMERSAARVLKAASPCRVKIFGHSVPQTPSVLAFRPLSLSSSSPSPRLRLAAVGAPVQLDLFPAPSPPSFSDQIRALRDRLGLSQRALAEKVGCCQPHIANVEHGRDRLGDWPRRRLRDLMQEAA